ncbi:phage gp6-like head-tail connector protein [Bradyrhizobium sp. CCBAU 53351]|uniref:head-tail connector protein n=1 Tax=Bradyrhizobium sp. CCBAU 53351 TaxID=1325114 RepID=UPI001889A09D|nr:head-tail connector protein [Bradyrhizobium sp. CCBAU 53351]QOZ76716.1 phage gp6-like head-tail connector protein [Bradyrhizobium sp. CCBAU 53351]
MPGITLDQAKAHLNVTFDADNALLTDKLAAAKAWVGAYTASDVDADGTPAPVNEAVLQLTAHLYQNREASLVGVTATELPFGFLDLLAPYRAFCFG